MSNEEMAAEIEQAVDEMMTADAGAEGKAAEEEVAQKADAVAESDEAKAAAEVAGVDEAADAEAAAREKLAGEAADEQGAVADEVGREVAAEKITREAAEAKAADSAVISDETLTRAVEVGIPLAEARQFPSEGSLISIVNRMEAAAQSVVGTEVEEEPEDPFADLPKLDPEVHDAEVIAKFDRLTEIAKQQYETIQAIQGRQEETSLAAQARAAEEVEQWFDKQVAGLGEDFVEALGAGGYASLSQGSSQYAKRKAIADQLSVLLCGYQASGQQVPPHEQLFDTAARLVLRDEYEAIQGKKLAGELEGQASQHLQRVGGRKAVSTQSPDDETAALLDAKFG